MADISMKTLHEMQIEARNYLSAVKGGDFDELSQPHQFITVNF